MGLGGIGIWQLLIILVIVIMLFGTKRLRSMGGDLGTAIKGFRSSIKADDSEEPSSIAGAAKETSEAAEKPAD